MRAYLSNPSKRFKIINDRSYMGQGGTDSEGFEGKANLLMPAVFKSTNVTLESNYGFEAFLANETEPKAEEPKPEDDINVLLFSNSVVNRRKFTFLRSEKTASEDMAKRDRLVKICRRCFTLPGYEQRRLWFERREDKKQTFCGITSDLGPEMIVATGGVSLRQA